MPNAVSSPSPPCVTADQMRTVDRIATNDYGVSLLQMMENAGRHLAHLAREQFLDGDVRRRSVLVVCGRGGNGGGGLAAARCLACWGADVWVSTLTAPADYTGVPARQLSLLRHMEVPVERIASSDDLPDGDLMIDALVGYGLEGEPRDELAACIRQIIWHGAPTLSLDVPSGLDATTGVPSDTTVHADATLTLALPKCGLEAPVAASAVGDLYLADIGIPPSLYDALDLNGTLDGLFARQDLIQLR